MGETTGLMVHHVSDGADNVIYSFKPHNTPRVSIKQAALSPFYKWNEMSEDLIKVPKFMQKLGSPDLGQVPQTLKPVTLCPAEKLKSPAWFTLGSLIDKRVANG